MQRSKRVGAAIRVRISVWEHALQRRSTIRFDKELSIVNHVDCLACKSPYRKRSIQLIRQWLKSRDSAWNQPWIKEERMYLLDEYDLWMKNRRFYFDIQVGQVSEFWSKFYKLRVVFVKHVQIYWTAKSSNSLSKNSRNCRYVDTFRYFP